MDKRCNCLVFAALAWWRWRRRGAYFALRRSRHIAGLHWLVYYRGRWIHFDPLAPKQNMVAAAFHKLWYLGRIRRGDE